MFRSLDLLQLIHSIIDIFLKHGKIIVIFTISPQAAGMWLVSHSLMEGKALVYMYMYVKHFLGLDDMAFLHQSGSCHGCGDNHVTLCYNHLLHVYESRSGL